MGFIGAGQMATALAVGFLRAGMSLNFSLIILHFALMIGKMNGNFAGIIEQNNLIVSASSPNSPSLQRLKVRNYKSNNISLIPCSESNFM